MPFELPVPKVLINFFKGGGLKNILDTAEKYGTGLQFINAMRKAFPITPGFPNDVYFQALSYMSQLAKAALQAGDYLTALKANQLVDQNQLPQNFYLRRPDNQMCNQFFRVFYQTYNPATGVTFNVQNGFWSDGYATAGELVGSLLDQAREQLDAVSVSARAARRYGIVGESFKIIAGVRLC